MDEKPTKRRGFQFSIVLMLLLVALFAEFFAAWRLTPKEPVYTPQNWLQIQKGMSRVEVEAIMGKSRTGFLFYEVNQRPHARPRFPLVGRPHLEVSREE
jgi:hypothetical protein